MMGFGGGCFEGEGRFGGWNYDGEGAFEGGGEGLRILVVPDHISCSLLGQICEGGGL